MISTLTDFAPSPAAQLTVWLNQAGNPAPARRDSVKGHLAGPACSDRRCAPGDLGKPLPLVHRHAGARQRMVDGASLSLMVTRVWC